MARRDYKSRAAQGRGKKPVPVWIWLLTGFILGAVSVGFICLQYGSAASGSNWIGAKPPTAPRAGKGHQPISAEPAKIKPPRFDFYNLLPDQEVLVSEDEIERQTKKTQPTKSPLKDTPAVVKTPETGKRYLVQVSSFRNDKDAQALKAKLGLLGLRAKVNKAIIKGKTWYRVQLGPYGNAAAMQDVRKQLASSGYQSLAIALR